MGPGKGVAKGGSLAGLELLKVDDVEGEQIFVLEGQSHVVQSGIIGANGDVYPRVKAAIEDKFERGQV